jgi:cytochrome P450
VTTGLIEAYDEDSEGLSEKNLLDSLLLLIGAGYETTVNLIDHAVVDLLTHPAELAKVRDGTVTWQDTVEEVLRHQAPIATMLIRFPITDIDDPATGMTFRTGEPIVVSYAAAGRDPAAHGDDADTFNVARSTRRDHLSFGHGAHYCLGAELARLEARIALSSLFDRFPSLRLAVSPDELEPVRSFISNGHRTLPVILAHMDTELITGSSSDTATGRPR